MFIGQSIANSMSSQATSQSDYQLQLYVDQVMRRYDANRNGILEPDEIALFFNELFSQYGINKRINQWEASNFMRKVDTNFDGKANKFELFRAFKAMMSNSGGLGAQQSNYAAEWNPNFSGYVQSPQVAPVSPVFNYLGGAATTYNPYGGYGAVGYTSPVVYNTYGGGYGGGYGGYYRGW